MAIAALALPGLVGVVATPVPAHAEAPVFLSPAPGAVLTGVVEVRVQSAARFVRIRFAGSDDGYVVATAEGVATWAWGTYGHANGPTTLTADGCDEDSLTDEPCFSERGHAELGVVLDNAPPVLISPTAGTVLSGFVTYRATTPEGGVAFRLTGCHLGPPDLEAPYAVTWDMTRCGDGTRQLEAVRCSRTRCGGPTSSAVQVTVRNLHPAIVARSTPAIDPVRAERRDVVRWTYRLGRAQYVRWRILKSDEVVRDWTSLGRQPTGLHTIAWAGRGDGGGVPPDGTYRLEIRTRAGELSGSVRSPVEVRTSGPRLSVLATTTTRFYPVRDGYRDLFRPRALSPDPAVLTLVVTDRDGHRVRTLRSPRIRTVPSWDGRDAGGRLVPAGSYRWRLLAEDDIGHVTRSSWRSVALSHRRAEIVVWTTSVRAARATTTYGASCAVDRASSFGPTGLVLGTTCDATTAPDPDVGTAVGATYLVEVAVPGALAYRGATVEAYARGTGDQLWGGVVGESGVGITGGSGHLSITRPGWYRLPSRPPPRPIRAVPTVIADLWVQQGAVDLRTVRLSVRAYVWAD